MNAHVHDGLSEACHSAYKDIPQHLYNHHPIQTILQSLPLLLHPSKLDGDKPVYQDQLILVLNLSKKVLFSECLPVHDVSVKLWYHNLWQSYSYFFGGWNRGCRFCCSYCRCDGWHCAQQPSDTQARIKYAFGCPGFILRPAEWYPKSKLACFVKPQKAPTLNH